MLNERQRELAMLLAMATSFISTVLILKHHDITILWVLYNIPTILVLISYPKWKAVFIMIGLILLSKCIMVYNYIHIDPIRFAVSSLVSISVFITMSYIIIQADRLIRKHKNK